MRPLRQRLPPDRTPGDVLPHDPAIRDLGRVDRAVGNRLRRKAAANAGVLTDILRLSGANPLTGFGEVLRDQVPGKGALLDRPLRPQVGGLRLRERDLRGLAGLCRCCCAVHDDAGAGAESEPGNRTNEDCGSVRL